MELPPQNQVLHTLLVASTGAGKTTLCDEALQGILQRGDRAIVVDPGGHHLSLFGRPDDIVLNPFDARSPGWSVFNEVRAEFDYFRLAKSLIPESSGSGRYLLSRLILRSTDVN